MFSTPLDKCQGAWLVLLGNHQTVLQKHLPCCIPTTVLKLLLLLVFASIWISAFWIWAILIGVVLTHRCFDSSTLYPSRAFPLPCYWLGWALRGQGMICPKQCRKEVRAELQNFAPTHCPVPLLAAFSFKPQLTYLPDTQQFQALFLEGSHLLLLLLLTLLVLEIYILLLLLQFFQC